jgi:hypothetical protein
MNFRPAPGDVRIGEPIHVQLARLSELSHLPAYCTLAEMWGNHNDTDVLQSARWIKENLKRVEMESNRLVTGSTLDGWQEKRHRWYLMPNIIGFGGFFAFYVLLALNPNISNFYVLCDAALFTCCLIAAGLVGDSLKRAKEKIEQLENELKAHVEVVKAFLNHLQIFIWQWPATETDPNRIQAQVNDGLNSLALQIVKSEKNVGELACCPERLQLSYYMEMAKHFGCADGNLTPYFMWAQDEWVRLATQGLVLTDFSI